MLDRAPTTKRKINRFIGCLLNSLQIYYIFLIYASAPAFFLKNPLKFAYIDFLLYLCSRKGLDNTYDHIIA